MSKKDPFDPASPLVNNAITYANAQPIDVGAADYSSVTASDNICRALYIGTGGDLKVDMYLNGDGSGFGQGVVFKNVPSGTVMSIRVVKVYMTGTTADDILLLW